MVSRKPQPKKSKEDVTFRFNVGVSIDADGETPACRYEAGDEVQAERLPPHADLQGLIAIGAIRPVEDID